MNAIMGKAMMLMSDGLAKEAYQVLERAREYVKTSPELESQFLRRVMLFFRE